MNMKAEIDRMALQRAEFDAADKLAEQLRRHNMTPVVDDDYTEVRHGYESALKAFIDAMKANGRFEKANRYGLVAAVGGLIDGLKWRAAVNRMARTYMNFYASQTHERPVWPGTIWFDAALAAALLELGEGSRVPRNMVPMGALRAADANQQGQGGAHSHGG